MVIEVGQNAPELNLRDRERQKVTLETYEGRHLVLAFYALAFTGG